MHTRSSRRPQVANQLAKHIVDIATGEVDDERRRLSTGGKNAAAVELGRLGGRKGGRARAEKLSADERRRIAQDAARARWQKNQVEGLSPSAPDAAASDRTVEVVGRELAEKFGCDIFLYNGPISEEMYGKVVQQIVRKKRKNLLVILVTLGGQANPAYRIARLFQGLSGKFTMLIPSYCKSAGTIVALGAHELWMSVFSELGPLDVQLAKYDEIGERRPGLTTHSAMESIKEQAFEMFGDTMMEIKRRSGFRVRFRTAADLATNLTVGLFSKIYDQLDPLAIGEDYRDLHVALEYGERLARHSQNLQPGAVSALIHNYPSHDFVIDDDEAKKLFRTVKQPPKEIFELLQLIGAEGIKPLTEDDGIFKFLSPELEQTGTDSVLLSTAEAAGDQDDVAVQSATEAAAAN